MNFCAATLKDDLRHPADLQVKIAANVTVEPYALITHETVLCEGQVLSVFGKTSTANVHLPATMAPVMDNQISSKRLSLMQATMAQVNHFLASNSCLGAQVW